MAILGIQLNAVSVVNPIMVIWIAVEFCVHIVHAFTSMGSNEMDKAPKEKESKTPPPMSQEQSSTTATGTINPDWPGFQAYSPIPPHSFLASSPQAHPYMWGPGSR
ncbi:hypothetical protein V8G54_009541 [Vigna mungo]|uniref:G-box binding protein multifunctional mosaic region domain-containing protein n=1 Tax=Vigna mungo TaxID=3915 RepID=A0AAQ3NV12_VIGMU